MNSKGAECRVKLRHCLAIILRKEGCEGDPGDFWMYESGYLLFQGLIAANSVCWWNSALQGATRGLIYQGYVSPGALLVSSEPCSLEIIRAVWAKRVLQPPVGYQIVGIEDIEECVINSIVQTHWTPLPEAICAVVLRLSSQGRPAGIKSISEALILAFPHVLPPSEPALYDTLVQLTTERKLYHTSKGYFIVTPEKRRSRSNSRGRQRYEEDNTIKGMLLSTEEALVRVHGEMATIRDGDVTHQCVQTNLADVICGGNSSDKIMYPRNNKRRSASFPSNRSPDRKGSFRLWGSSRRLSRSASTRTIARTYIDNSCSTEYRYHTEPVDNYKRPSLLSRLFRRSKRFHNQINTFGAQFPPMEWFNSKATHLHSVATQTTTIKKESSLSLPYYLDNAESGFTRSATLPRQRRQLPNDSTYTASYAESPSLRYSSPVHISSSTLPRNPNKGRNASRSHTSSRKASHSSLSTKICISDNEIQNNISHVPPPTNNVSRGSKMSSLESLKVSHEGNSSHKSEQNAKNDLIAGATSKSSTFKNSSTLDNSGPSSIESYKSGKTSSSLTSGPSSLESYRTVLKAPTINNSNSTNFQNADLELGSMKRASPKRRSKTKYKLSTNVVTNDNTDKSAVSHNSAFTLELIANQGGTSCSNNSSKAMTATVNSDNTMNAKIYVQNSPVRSVITFENGKHSSVNPNVVIINRTESVSEQNNSQQNVGLTENKDMENREQAGMKNTNSMLNTEGKGVLNNSILVDHTNTTNNETMNYKKFSLQDDLCYRNLLKSPVPCTQNTFNSCLELSGINRQNSLSNTSLISGKCYDSSCSSGDISNKMTDSKLSLNKYCNKTDLENSYNFVNLTEKNTLGSQPNISCKETDKDKSLVQDRISEQQFPSLGDLNFNFTSLAAQKILKGISINSIDTLVELNTDTAEKQNNCDVVHTDFGVV
ncbi:hypothetical protein ILUMI_23968 [Ignelater luminosus]|uniref:Winged helix Storkhead-box1 domain-containing protein n=1 Tax=Ignelater luminosus TaxID=2038154 RepID=A0A8K0CB53_IGNLU|nr:hypothetical protein ILUMI_23968 [Ignelater luminosus]